MINNKWLNCCLLPKDCLSKHCNHVVHSAVPLVAEPSHASDLRTMLPKVLRNVNNYANPADVVAIL